ncbi:class I SAM-dependent methyltransferase [Clostridium ihumii]|uniref:class I SAM-dependent methyltransferase n=1 Tax=Clostridium ihumii TaxID=1470356 RepID=UPI003D357F5D
MENTVFINLQDQIFSGNILDIGKDNYGVIYNLFKYLNNDGDINYVEKNEKCSIECEQYDNCVLFFSLSTMTNVFEREQILEEAYKYLKRDGILYIWDIEKKKGKTYEKNIKVYMPDKSLKKINIKDGNLLKISSIDRTISLLSKKFEVLYSRVGNEIYHITCRKRR